MRRSKVKQKAAPKRVLRLPDLDRTKVSFLNTLGSPQSQRAYAIEIDDFIGWYCSERRIAFKKTVVLRYRMQPGDQCAFIDLFGKGGHIRSVPVPDWVKSGIDRWTAAAQIESGSLFRCVTKCGRVWGKKITEKVIWHVVRKNAMRSELGNIAPHDLRRTCARNNAARFYTLDRKSGQ